MALLKHISFYNEREDIPTEDDIDELFCQLRPIEPPPTLVEDILNAVKLFSLPQPESSNHKHCKEELVVQRETLPPS